MNDEDPKTDSDQSTPGNATEHGGDANNLYQGESVTHCPTCWGGFINEVEVFECARCAADRIVGVDVLRRKAAALRRAAEQISEQVAEHIARANRIEATAEGFAVYREHCDLPPR